MLVCTQLQNDAAERTVCGMFFWDVLRVLLGCNFCVASSYIESY